MTDNNKITYNPNVLYIISLLDRCNCKSTKSVVLLFSLLALGCTIILLFVWCKKRKRKKNTRTQTQVHALWPDA